ncbi:hypothetical protein BH11MYX1_BH11MYX1_37210 [soil metagenome]
MPELGARVGRAPNGEPSRDRTMRVFAAITTSSYDQVWSSSDNPKLWTNAIEWLRHED